MKIFVIGSGGREHALCHQFHRSGHAVYAAPGNPGMAACAEILPILLPHFDELIKAANLIKPDLVVIGPEGPLIDGLGNRFRAAGFAVFGPDAAAAALEGSKAFSKQLMAEANVPTAKFQLFTEFEPAVACAREFCEAGNGVVVKASGNALGKGAIVCASLSEAEDALDSMLRRHEFGDAGTTVVVEERLGGREFSLLTLISDGAILSLPVAQDHKRAFDGDKGPNTGGMGSFSPVPWVTGDMVRRAEAEIVTPIIQALSKQGVGFRGVLFSGIMTDGVRMDCLEYNVRFGDPETQSVVTQSGPELADALLACALGQPIPKVSVIHPHALTVVIASANYPDSPSTGHPITPPPCPESVTIFHAGTKLVKGDLVNSGGRVFGVTAVAETHETARQMAYQVAKQVQFQGAWMRNDIGGNEPIS